MARLNEAPAPAPETIEALKRKWTRQNREIVRTNTAQSARIRNLECEITRLLNENLQWREEAISARAEAEKWRGAQKLSKEVLRMKQALEVKLSQVNELVGELGSLPDKVARRSSQQRRKDGFASELFKMAEQREPRQHRQTMLEQDGRLPAILEDKYYPRKTLEASEITRRKSDAAEDTAESPELGPPPVAHFDEGDAVAFDAARSPRRTSTELIQESETMNRPSLTGLENRRKRRTSTLLQSSDFDTSESELDKQPAMSTIETQNEKKQAPPQLQSILKKGAKRKLEVSELEDTSKVSKELDEFIFQRRAATHAAAAKPSRFSRPPGRPNHENAGETADRSPERPVQPARRILAPKSANSPAKRKVGTASEKPESEEDGKANTKAEKRVVSRIRARPTVMKMPPSSEPAQQPEEDNRAEQTQPMPKTPAAELEDIMSPMSTELSSKQRQPMEAAISHSVEDVLNGSIGRGSRRARAAVSYAEPNLRDKMRRPGKELVSAVEGLSRQHLDAERSRTRSSGVDPSQESNAMSVKASASKSGKAQKDWPDDDAAPGGKVDPSSPLRDKIAPSSGKSDRQAQAEDTGDLLSVFDPPTSSPVAAEPENSRADKARDEHSVLKSRRHSVQSTSSRQNGSSILRTRRPSSVSDVRRDDVDASQDTGRGHVRRAASVTGLPKGHILKDSDLATMPSSASGIASDSEDHRTRHGGLSRRRSLMV